ncbi:SulA-like leucine-rich domain-containing protein [Vibrio gallicus]|uniref:SulA-like leucine-rich domain-containing protein n=1 Tax=Vibrio gallicus TaxID=190897 RepID=UPI0021C49695|nr:SulA-like leucine-rich domain-containing protein [Vibrio gallicus]
MHFNNTYHSTQAKLSQCPMAESIVTLLAKVSIAKKWILFTAQTDLPEKQFFKKHQVECAKIVQLKPSSIHNEMEIVIRAIHNGNASAVVASNNFDSTTQAHLMRLAQQNDCCLIFNHAANTLLH